MKIPNEHTFAVGDTVIFTHPIINIGNGYHTDFGFFGPPVNGTYSFSAQICTKPGSWIVFGLMKNSDILDETFVGDHDWHQCATTTAFIYATTVDKVLIKVLRQANGVVDKAAGISSFTAALINTYPL